MPGNNNNNNLVPASNSENNENGNNGNNNPQANNNDPTAANSNARSQSSAEGTRRVNPGTGKAKTKAQIQAAVMMKRAKKVLNNALSIKSTPPEFNPLIKIMKRENFANAAAKQAAINAYVAEVRAKRNAKATTAKAPKKAKAANANTTVSNKPKRKYVRKAKAANTAEAAPAPAEAAPTAVASGEKKAKRKVENPTNLQTAYKANMAAAKKLVNNALGIKSMPPEHNPLVGIMRKEYASEAEKKAAINAHIEKVRAARAEKASKKAAKGGSRKTRKNRTRKNRRS
jgi:hypothetical protein